MHSPRFRGLHQTSELGIENMKTGDTGSNRGALIVTWVENMRNLVHATEKRCAKNNGNISANGMFADIASAVFGRPAEWVDVTQCGVCPSPGVSLKYLINQADGKPPVMVPLQDRFEFEFVSRRESGLKSRLLDLAAQWQNGNFENRHCKKVICRFGGKEVFETELVYLADLVNAWETSEVPVFQNSLWELMRPWASNDSEGYLKFTAGLRGHLVQNIKEKMAYRVPMDPSDQIKLNLDIWACQKFEILGYEYSEVMHQLLLELELVEAPEDPNGFLTDEEMNVALKAVPWIANALGITDEDLNEICPDDLSRFQLISLYKSLGDYCSSHEEYSAWLRSPSQGLDDRTPMDLMKLGQISEALQSLQSLLDGS